jgi:hypothetical protein
MARYRARQIIAEQYRWAGRKLASVRVRQWHADTEAYFQAHRAELIAQAQIDVAKIKNSCTTQGRLKSLNNFGTKVRCEMIIGYARCSTEQQDYQSQLDALHAAGCERVYSEKESGAKSDRRQLANALNALGPGGVLVVTKLDRLARSLKDLLLTLDAITAAGAGFKCLDVRRTLPHRTYNG